MAKASCAVADSAILSWWIVASVRPQNWTGFRSRQIGDPFRNTFFGALVSFHSIALAQGSGRWSFVILWKVMVWLAWKYLKLRKWEWQMCLYNTYLQYLISLSYTANTNFSSQIYSLPGWFSAIPIMFKAHWHSKIVPTHGLFSAKKPMKAPLERWGERHLLVSAIPFISLVCYVISQFLDFRKVIDKIRRIMRGQVFFFAFQDKKCFEIKDGVPYHLENLRTDDNKSTRFCSLQAFRYQGGATRIPRCVTWGIAWPLLLSAGNSAWTSSHQIS